MGFFFDGNRFSRSYYDIEWDFMNTRYDEKSLLQFFAVVSTADDGNRDGNCRLPTQIPMAEGVTITSSI